MKNRLFVGNLPHKLTNEELKEIFEECGKVLSAHIIFDRATQRSKGFGFVEMENEDSAKSAIEALDSKEVMGRPMAVKIANPREERPSHSSRPKFNNHRD